MMSSISRSNVAVVVAVAIVTVTLVSNGVLVGTLADEETDNFRLSKHPENGRFIEFDSQNELELNISESNPNVTANVTRNMKLRLDRTFNITYIGDTQADVWINDSASDVTFYRDDATGNSLEGSSNSVELDPDETLVVGVLVDTRGNSDVSSLDSFRIEAEINESDGGDGGDGDDGGGGPSGSSLGIGSKVRLSVENAEAGRPVSIDVQSTAPMRETGVSVESVELTLAQGGSASLEIDTKTDPRRSTPANAESLFAYEVDTDLTANDIERATVRLTVDRSRVDDPEAVEALRRTDTGWESVDTTLVERNAGEFVYEVTTSEFSLFALVETTGPTPTPTETTGPEQPTDTPGPEQPTDTPGPEQPTDTPGPEQSPTGQPTPGFGVVAAVLALLAGGLVIRRRG